MVAIIEVTIFFIPNLHQPNRWLFYACRKTGLAF